MDRKDLGKFGEETAGSILQNHGYSILENNYSCKLGEIDIIALKDGYLVFIEVKTRRSLKYGLPQEAITDRKKKKIRKVAECYLMQHNMNNARCRFDVLCLLLKFDKYCVEIIEDAF